MSCLLLNLPIVHVFSCRHRPVNIPLQTQLGFFITSNTALIGVTITSVTYIYIYIYVEYVVSSDVKVFSFQAESVFTALKRENEEEKGL